MLFGFSRFLELYYIDIFLSGFKTDRDIAYNHQMYEMWCEDDGSIDMNSNAIFIFCSFFMALNYILIFSVDGIERGYISHQPKMVNLDPADKPAIMHYGINAVNMTIKFAGDFNCRKGML